MKKSLIKVLAVTVIAILACGGQLQAQNLLKGLKDAAQKAVGGTVSGQSSTPNTNAPANRAPAAKGKTYYVRVRTYKTVSSVKYYSMWSAVKSLKLTK